MLGGAGNSAREMLGHLYASQIAHLVTTRNPNEGRTLVLGLGLDKAAATKMDREGFAKVMELVAQCV